jgi:hypothetical protein
MICYDEIIIRDCRHGEGSSNSLIRSEKHLLLTIVLFRLSFDLEFTMELSSIGLGLTTGAYSDLFLFFVLE